MQAGDGVMKPAGVFKANKLCKIIAGSREEMHPRPEPGAPSICRGWGWGGTRFLQRRRNRWSVGAAEPRGKPENGSFQ